MVFLSFSLSLSAHSRVTSNGNHPRQDDLTWNQFCRNYQHRMYGICVYKTLQLVHWERIDDRLEWIFSLLVHHWDNQAEEERRFIIVIIIRTREKKRRKCSLSCEWFPFNNDIGEAHWSACGRSQVFFSSLLRRDSFSLQSLTNKNQRMKEKITISEVTDVLRCFRLLVNIELPVFLTYLEEMRG